MTTTTKLLFVWVVLLFFLVAIADYAPKLAVGLVLLLMADVALINSDKYRAILTK